MENRNLTIVFTKGGINELRKQLDAVSTYCFNNNLFIEKIIVTNNKYYRKSFLKILAILQFREIKTHIVVYSEDVLILNDEAEEALENLTQEGKIELHFIK